MSTKRRIYLDKFMYLIEIQMIKNLNDKRKQWEKWEKLIEFHSFLINPIHMIFKTFGAQFGCLD